MKNCSFALAMQNIFMFYPPPQLYPVNLKHSSFKHLNSIRVESSVAIWSGSTPFSKMINPVSAGQGLINFCTQTVYGSPRYEYLMERSKLALLNNLRVYIQILALVGGMSRRQVSSYESEYLYIHKYLYNKILVS